MAAQVEPGKLEISARFKTFMFVSMFVGAVSFLFGVFNPSEYNTVWQSFLTSFFYFSSLALGGLFFTAIQHVTNAGWSVTVRRISEGLTSFLPVSLLMAIILVAFGAHSLYEWLHPEVVANDYMLQNKAPYLNMTFFAIRTVVFFLGWLLLAKILVGNSLKQDETGDEKLTLKNNKWSVIFLLFFAISYSLFSVDFLMSLHAHWFSTIFGVYTFAGLFQSSLAFMIILLVWLRNQDLLNGLVNENHLHDLGKFLFAFTVFYAYIGFSQFMLIWYANLPEETIFFVHRAHGGWMWVSMSLLLFKFVVPFFALLPRGAKRNPQWLVMVSVLLLIMQYVDNYWLVYPNFFEGHLVFGFMEVGIFLGFLGLFLFAVTRFLSKYPLVPVKDPRMSESLHHHI